MRCITICSECGSSNVDYVENNFEKCYCHDCNKITLAKDKYILSPYERTRNAVYATGNRWAIENFNATHN